MPATLAELEARVAALEAEHVDYRAVLTAVNALGENQREMASRVHAVEDKLEGNTRELEANTRKLDENSARIRSIEDNLAEVKDLLVRALGGGG